MVSSDESGQRRLTALGKGAAGSLARGGLYYDDALRYVATLMEAYEPVARARQSGLPEIEALSFSMLQESIVRSIGGIEAAAEPPPRAEDNRTDLETLADAVRIALDSCMADPHSRQVIQT
jgi:hypothetical protein